LLIFIYIYVHIRKKKHIRKFIFLFVYIYIYFLYIQLIKYISYFKYVFIYALCNKEINLHDILREIRLNKNKRNISRVFSLSVNTYMGKNNYIILIKFNNNYNSNLMYKNISHILVTSSIKEPIPGWIDNFYGPLGLSIGTGRRILRTMYANKYVCEDIVPIDIVIKAVLVVIWKLGLTKYDYQLTFTTLIVSNYKHENFLSLLGTASIHI